MVKSDLRNILVCMGAYYLSLWAAYPLILAVSKLTVQINFGSGVGISLLINFPLALVAFGVGVCVVLLVESRRPLPWIVLPAALYISSGFRGWHWAQPTIHADLIDQLVAALFPALMCIVGAITGARWRVASPGLTGSASAL